MVQKHGLNAESLFWNLIMLTGATFLKGGIKIWPLKYEFESLATILKIDVKYGHKSALYSIILVN